MNWLKRLFKKDQNARKDQFFTFLNTETGDLIFTHINNITIIKKTDSNMNTTRQVFINGLPNMWIDIHDGEDGVNNYIDKIIALGQKK